MAGRTAQPDAAHVASATVQPQSSAVAAPKATLISEGSASTTDQNTLEVYPNPTAEHATIHFHTRKGGKAQVYLYNQLGVLVATLYNAEVESDRDYYLPFSRTSIEDGVYFCRLITNGQVQNKRIVFMK